jgi:hypothetical protein
MRLPWGLIRQLPDDLIAKLETTEYCKAIVTLGGSPLRTGEAPTWADLLPDQDTLRLSRIAIRDRVRRRLVAAIELLSPNVKQAGSDREQYLAKRNAINHSPAHLIEIDLLRGGRPMPMQNLVDSDYRVMVHHAPHRPRVGVWPIRLREPLPTVPIPLTAEHDPVMLDLMPPLHAAYDAAGYRKYIYTGTPEPPLHPEDAAWAKALADPANAA